MKTGPASLATLGERSASSATVLGHSVGGGIAIQFAYQFPDRCERLVLVSSGGLGPDVGLIVRLASLSGSQLVISVAAPAGRTLANVAARAGRAVRLRPTADAEHYARAFVTLAESESRAAFLGTLRGVVATRGQLVHARDRVYVAEHVPTLVVWGARDAVLPVDHDTPLTRPCQAAGRRSARMPASCRSSTSPHPSRRPRDRPRAGSLSAPASSTYPLLVAGQADGSRWRPPTIVSCRVTAPSSFR